MNISIVIPTYWKKTNAEAGNNGDIIYDHPTPLNQEGTLARALKSLNVLKNKDFQVFVIAASETEGIEDDVEKKVESIIKNSTSRKIKLFSYSHLDSFKKKLKDMDKEMFTDFLSLRGYSQIRNVGLTLPHLMGSDLIVFFDDDEIYEDPHYLEKAVDFIGKRIENKTVLGKAGLYINEDGNYKLSIPDSIKQSDVIWDKTQKMNEAFDYVTKDRDRIVETPFAFGGNMVISKKMFMEVPFDPVITRGEDIDYLVNARMLGFSFFLDSELKIKHLPPETQKPKWLAIRQDIKRFLYEKKKIILSQKNQFLHPVYLEDMDPYPGVFLRDNLNEKIMNTSITLFQEYMEEANQDDGVEATRNIKIATDYEKSIDDPAMDFVRLSRKWKKFMTWIEDNRKQLHKLLPE